MDYPYRNGYRQGLAEARRWTGKKLEEADIRAEAVRLVPVGLEDMDRRHRKDFIDGFVEGWIDAGRDDVREWP